MELASPIESFSMKEAKKLMKRQLIMILGILVLVVSAVATPVPSPGAVSAQAQGAGLLDPTSIPQFQEPLTIPPAMPRSGKIKVKGGKNIEYYEIAVRQFEQQILPTGMPATTVWSYGSVDFPGTVDQGGSFNYPAFTIEAKWNKPVRVKWINDLVDANGNYLPHLLPVDQTLHWANPPGGLVGRDTRGTNATSYTGPVPIITHVHGAHTYEESDGYPEAWYLPAANNIPGSYATGGSYYEAFNSEFQGRYGAAAWNPGEAVFQYPNDQRATTLWYHDHTLGMTRVNVYAGPAGFYILRGGPGDEVLDSATGDPATLPGPAPALGDAAGIDYYELPVVIQDRSFNTDGSLSYPDNRAFFEGLEPSQLQIPFIPDAACNGTSDVSAIWQPEFFGNTMVVNGKAWPYQDVEQRRYRLRLLNGCNSRFLILQFSDPNVQVWQIGADGGFLSAPLDINAANGGMMLLGPAERADVIVDFTNVPAGTDVMLHNIGPDEPFGGGVPGIDFLPADPATTGRVMQFRVKMATGPDSSTPPSQLILPPVTAPVVLPPADPVNEPYLNSYPGIRSISLNEEESKTVFITEDADGNIIFDCNSTTPFGPTAALLGNLATDASGNRTANALGWMDPITENPTLGATETWEIYNFTVDAHPIHIHLVQFQVVDRQALVTDIEGMAVQPVQFAGSPPRPPEAWETGYKDTVIAYPGEVTRVQAIFDYEGLYVWHCHIIEHEDNEMMRPYYVGTMP
jgi:FtsP/CotA-like multicopper oxidase with cupredoxin domain